MNACLNHGRRDICRLEDSGNVGLHTADLGHSPLPMPSPPERRCLIFAPRLRVVCPTPDSWRAKFESSVLRGIFMDNLQAAIAMPPTSAMNARRFTQSPRRRWRVTPVVFFLSSFSAGDRPHHTEAFRQGLNETGYGEGRNLAIEYPFADNRLEQLEPLAADLLACNVAVIAAVGGNNSALVAKRLTSTIPILFTSGLDPVKAGLVSSFNRPGANVTGAGTLLRRLLVECCFRIVPIHQKGDEGGLRDELVEHLEVLAPELGREPADAGDVRSRPVEAGNEPSLDRVEAAGEKDRNRRR